MEVTVLYIFSLKLGAKTKYIVCHTWLGLLDPGNGTDRFVPYRR